MAVDRLSPHSVALSHLLEMFCSYEAQPPHAFPLPSRHHLALLLLRQINPTGPTSSVLEPSCAATLQSVSCLPPCFVEAFEARLVGTTNPDDLWTLMTALSDAIETPPLLCEADGVMEGGRGPAHLERTSVLGLYVRRVLLAFRRSTFESLCTLTSHFKQWVHAPREQEREVGRGGRGSEEVEAIPAWVHSPPLKQMEAAVSRMVQLVEGGSGADVDELNARVEQLKLFAPKIPQVHYLRMLLHVHERSFEQAPRRYPIPRASSRAPAPSHTTHPP